MKPWFIKEAGFFEGMSVDDLALFRQVCPPQHHEKNSHIFHAGNPAAYLHVIDEGQIKLTLPTLGGKERILAVCGPGDLIGEVALKSAGRYHEDAVALTEVVTCPMNREQFLQITQKSATFALAFAEILADHLSHCRNLLSESFDPVKLRVVKALLKQVQHFGKPLDEPDWYMLETELTHEDIASIVAATRIAVSHVFAELREEGLVEGSRGHYRLHVPALERLLEQS